MMKTKFSTLIATLLFIVCVQAYADQGIAVAVAAKSGISAPASVLAAYSAPSVTSALKNDSLAPKEDFDDLFTVETVNTTAVRLNPRAVSFVEDYMDKNTVKLLKLKDWGRPYFNMMDAVLKNHGLPTELKYLAVIESELKSTARSWAGAVGPWQFMAGTARGYGLVVNKSRDDRRDYKKSTNAAAKYLKALHKEFGDWLLVIAAYNGGPGVVYNAMKKSNSKNFWDLQYHLPTESRNHVKKFIGTHYIFEGQGGITTLTKAEAFQQIEATASHMLTRKISSEELKNTLTTNISGKYHSQVIAKNILMDIKDFNRFNPEFDRLISLGEEDYELKLPSGKMDLFIANKYQILNESVNLLLAANANTKAVGREAVAAK